MARNIKEANQAGAYLTGDACFRGGMQPWGEMSQERRGYEVGLLEKIKSNPQELSDAEIIYANRMDNEDF